MSELVPKHFNVAHVSKNVQGGLFVACWRAVDFHDPLDRISCALEAHTPVNGRSDLHRAVFIPIALDLIIKVYLEQNGQARLKACEGDKQQAYVREELLLC